MGARMLAALGALVALGVAAAEAHRRDMARIAVTDAAMDGYRAGIEHGARQEAARIAAEREAEDDAGPYQPLEIESLEHGPEGLRVIGHLPAGALADQMAADLAGLSIGWQPEDVDAAVARFVRQLETRGNVAGPQLAPGHSITGPDGQPIEWDPQPFDFREFYRWDGPDDASRVCAVCGALVPPGEAVWQPELGGWAHPTPGDTGGCE